MKSDCGYTNTKAHEIVSLYKAGFSSIEIAERCACKPGYVGTTLKRKGLILTSEQKQRSKDITNKKISEKLTNPSGAIKLIESVGDFEYVGGYTHYDCTVSIKCKTCGGQFNKSLVSVRKSKSLDCPCCKNIEKEKRLLHEKEQKQLAKIERQKQMEEQKEEAERKRIHNCPVCGSLTTRRGCCSEKCGRTHSNRLKDGRRRAKLVNALVDSDIELIGLYKRDSGKCYLCGCVCDFNDKVVLDNGTFIAGSSYPSIDHVIPLSKGGEHSWNNVMLACRKCNWVKRDKYPPAREKPQNGG